MEENGQTLLLSSRLTPLSRLVFPSHAAVSCFAVIGRDNPQGRWMMGDSVCRRRVA